MAQSKLTTLSIRTREGDPVSVAFWKYSPRSPCSPGLASGGTRHEDGITGRARNPISHPGACRIFADGARVCVTPSRRLTASAQAEEAVDQAHHCNQQCNRQLQDEHDHEDSHPAARGERRSEIVMDHCEPIEEV